MHLAHRVLDDLGYVGVLCVEFFVTGDGRVLVNEIAPRPHNSGHFTIDACVTSQFEQQVRAICGLSLGDTAQMKPAAMVNLLGDLWIDGEPDWAAALAVPDVKLHLYGKGRSARRPQDGPHHGARGFGGRGRGESAGGPRRALLMITMFGPFQIDPRTWLLTRRRPSRSICRRAWSKSSATSCRATGQIVTKDELLERFWPDVNVTENTLTRAIADIRKAIGDDAAEPQYLETASRRGYRFIGESSRRSSEPSIRSRNG